MLCVGWPLEGVAAVQNKCEAVGCTHFIWPDDCITLKNYGKKVQKVEGDAGRHLEVDVVTRVSRPILFVPSVLFV